MTHVDDDGTIKSVEKSLPQHIDAEVIDYGGKLIMPSFVDMHLHAPQYPMLGMGMDLPLIDWLNTYTVGAMVVEIGGIGGFNHLKVTVRG